MVGAAVLLLSAASCSGADVPRVADACSLLTREEVSTAVQAAAQPGVLTSAIGESKKRLCSFQVSGTEDVKRFETVNDYLFCMSAWSGLLIQATVGMWGGRGRPANRDGSAWNAALNVTVR